MIVLFSGSMGPLLLTKVIRNDDGSLKSGFVVNGGWNFEIRNGEYLAKEGNRIVTRVKVSDSELTHEVAVPKSKEDDDYNDIIYWAAVEIEK